MNTDESRRYVEMQRKAHEESEEFREHAEENAELQKDAEINLWNRRHREAQEEAEKTGNWSEVREIRATLEALAR